MPGGLKAWYRERAASGGQPLNSILVAALEDYRAHADDGEPCGDRPSAASLPPATCPQCGEAAHKRRSGEDFYGELPPGLVKPAHIAARKEEPMTIEEPYPQEWLDRAAAELARQHHGGPADPDDIKLASEVLGAVLSTPAGVSAALKSVTSRITTSARDFSDYGTDAWVYGIAVGWDCEEDHDHDGICGGAAALDEVAVRHGWNEAAVTRLRAHRKAYAAAAGWPGSTR